jgi:Bacterial PH domain
MTQTALRFRHNTALTVAAVVVMLALISVLTYAPYLLVLEVIPLAVAIWAWRAGTDVSPAGLTVQALLGRRSIPWHDVSALVADDRGRVSAQLSSGRAVPLPAVGRADLPRLTALAAGEPVSDPR